MDMLSGAVRRARLGTRSQRHQATRLACLTVFFAEGTGGEP